MFQSIINNIFHDLLDNEVIVYLNNILIYTDNIAKCLPLVQEVLSRLNKAHLRMTLKKSFFYIKKVELLGFIISERGIEMSERKIEDVRN